MVKKEKSLFDKFIQLLTHQVDKSPQGLKKYDLVIVGNELGCNMTNNFVHFTHGHKTILHQTAVREIRLKELRILNETRIFEADKYSMGVSEGINLSVAKESQNMPAKIDPEHNKIIFKNGAEVEYNALILDNGLTLAPETIPGLMEGLNEPKGNVYSPLSGTPNIHNYGFFPLFSHGQAFIYIPEFPFVDEIENLNFLIALSTWEISEKLGLVSPLRNLTIINANDRFASKCSVLDKFITDRLAQHSKFDVWFNTKLDKIDNGQKKLTVTDKEGHQKVVDFDRIYCHIPTKADQVLVDSGFLKNGEKQVKVNPQTLQYGNYDNVFMLGDAVDLPMQRSFFAGIHQGHVIRHNALEIIEGRRPTANYDLHTRLPIFTGRESASFYESKLGSEPKFTNPMFEGFAYSKLTGGYAKKQIKTWKGKNAGPGYYRYPKYPKGEQYKQVEVSEHH